MKRGMDAHAVMNSSCRMGYANYKWMRAEEMYPL